MINSCGCKGIAMHSFCLVCLVQFTLHMCSLYCRYGFQKSPKLDLVAKPKLGHREVTYSRVTHWIEKKLCELVDVSILLCTCTETLF